MKAVILAGGLGTRLSEETLIKPKPMVEIGGMPILWHIMKIYSFYGINDFIICCGYKGYLIKEYFSNYFLHLSDVTFDIKNQKMQVHKTFSEEWNVTLVDTGVNTMTGGRLKRIKNYLSDEDFCFTYGDGLSDVNLAELIKFHKEGNHLATLTAAKPPSRFGSLKLGSLKLTENNIESFQEKPKDTWINGGFFVMSPEVLNYIDDDSTTWEKEPMEKLALEGEFKAFKHNGFWQPMDTLRDKNYLEQLWASNNAPWKIW